MMQWLDRLNLQPHEKRWLLVGLLIVAAVLNYWLVWPYFGEWSTLGTDRQKLEDSRNRYLSEIGKKAAYEKKLKDLQKAGAEVVQEDQANRLQSTLITQANANGVQAGNFKPINTSSRGAGQTNAFFDEQQMTFDVTASEPELVVLLYSLGSGDSMIRVRDISRLRLDPSQTRLTAQVTVLASFQKKPKAPPKAPTPAPTAAKAPAAAKTQAVAPKSTSSSAAAGGTNAAKTDPKKP